MNSAIVPKICRKIRWKPRGTLGVIDEARSVVFSRDGKLVAAGGGGSGQADLWPGEARIWEVESGAVFGTYRFPTYIIYATAFSPDGKTFVTTGRGDYAGRRTGQTTLWDVASGRERVTLPDSAAVSVSFSPDGKRLVVGSSPLKCFDPITGAPYGMPKIYAGVDQVAFSPDAKYLVLCQTSNLG